MTPFQGFLAAMADSDFSLAFYILGVFQLVVLGIGLWKPEPTMWWYRILLGIALSALPVMLGAGYYFALQSVA